MSGATGVAGRAVAVDASCTVTLAPCRTSPALCSPVVCSILPADYVNQVSIFDFNSASCGPADEPRGQLPLAVTASAACDDVDDDRPSVALHAAVRPGPSAFPPYSNPGRTHRFYTGTPVLPFGFGALVAGQGAQTAGGRWVTFRVCHHHRVAHWLRLQASRTRRGTTRRFLAPLTPAVPWRS